MKLLKTESPYLDRAQVKKVLLALTIMTIVLYIVAMIFSLCGSEYFILNYQNTQMDKIEEWFKARNIYALITFLFLTFESSLILCFILQKIVKWYHCLSFYLINIPLAFIFKDSFSDIYAISQIVLIGVFIILDNVLDNKRLNWKQLGITMLRVVTAILVVFILQVIIYIIKSGNLSMEYIPMNLSAMFIYDVEYYIALLVIFSTISLYTHREKGDSKVWVTDVAHGSSSQISTKNSLKSSQKNLTKTQRSKLRRFYIKVYFTQTFGFLLLMVLPFLIGKVFEFLVMYTAFAITRYILGFKYSLHFKKESICITVGVIVFGILALAVPFFTVLVILALILGTSLAVLLHLSYKYKGMWFFQQVSKPDKFALLYTFFDGDLTEHHVKKMCCYKGLTVVETSYIWDFVQGNKLSYLAWKYNYSQRMFIYKLDEAIEKLIA